MGKEKRKTESFMAEVRRGGVNIFLVAQVQYKAKKEIKPSPKEKAKRFAAPKTERVLIGRDTEDVGGVYPRFEDIKGECGSRKRGSLSTHLGNLFAQAVRKVAWHERGGKENSDRMTGEEKLMSHRADLGWEPPGQQKAGLNRKDYETWEKGARVCG